MQANVIITAFRDFWAIVYSTDLNMNNLCYRGIDIDIQVLQSYY